jgi:hypothetical protein
MAKIKYDGVVEAVRYKPDGEIDWVRAYERRGSAFSDYLLIDRQTLIKRLKSGKRFVVGERIPYLAGTFKVSAPIRLVDKGSQEIIVTGDADSHDRLDGVPLI